jgi:hypothetical protein
MVEEDSEDCTQRQWGLQGSGVSTPPITTTFEVQNIERITEFYTPSRSIRLFRPSPHQVYVVVDYLNKGKMYEFTYTRYSYYNDVKGRSITHTIQHKCVLDRLRKAEQEIKQLRKKSTQDSQQPTESSESDDESTQVDSDYESDGQSTPPPTPDSGKSNNETNTPPHTPNIPSSESGHDETNDKFYFKVDDVNASHWTHDNCTSHIRFVLKRLKETVEHQLQKMAIIDMNML